MRIIYGIQSEGMGHVIRSSVLIKHLNKHKIIAACGGRAYSYMRERHATEHIGDFHLVYKNSAVRPAATLLSNLKGMPQALARSTKLFRLIHNFRPHVIITDFEPFTAYAAALLSVPLLSLDNQHVQTRTAITQPTGYKWDKFLSKIIIDLSVPHANHYAVTSLKPVKATSQTTILPPIVRDSYFTVTPKRKNHFVVYQTTTANTLLRKLKQLPYEFRVYGYNKNIKQGNLTLRTFTEQQMLNDLATCKGVISGGGFGVISEALTLGKPIFCMPINHQYEQLLTAHTIQEHNWGMWAQTIDQLPQFIDKLDHYYNHLKAYQRTKPNHVAKKVNNILTLLSSQHSTSRAHS